MSSKFIRKRRKFSSISKIISVKSQLERIRKTFPNVQILKSDTNSFEVAVKLQPTLLSKKYDVKICYDRYGEISIFVINEKLKIAENREKLPHVFSHEKQELCLFSYGKNEWTRTKSICSTIIPWASEWLYYYELWLINGDWLGGGHNEYGNHKKEKIEEKI